MLEGKWDSRGSKGVQGVGLTNVEAMQEAGLSVVDFVNVRMGARGGRGRRHVDCDCILTATHSPV